MPSHKILVLDGHPAQRSLSRLFADAYAAAARRAGHQVKVVHLSNMDFDIDFGQGNYRSFKPLEPVLEDFMDQLQWADHFVLATPMWWGALPAKTKGLFDRAFVPGLAFNTKVKKMGMPTPMLGGKTGRMIITSDTPRWFFRLIYRSAFVHMMHGQVLKFVGIKPRKPLWFSGASEATDATVAGWVRHVERAAATDLGRPRRTSNSRPLQKHKI